MMEHRNDISKCAQARVSEEFYRLLRAGAAHRSMELLLQAELLELLAPDLARALRGEPENEEAVRRRARFWAYLAALDRSTGRRAVPPSNSLILAVLMLPPLRDALDPDTGGVGDVGQLVAQSIQPTLERLRASRRDGELARQILLAIRYILPSKHPRRKRPRLAGREFFDEALRLCEIISDAEAVDPTLAGQPIPAPEGEGAGLAHLDDDSAPELEPLETGDRAGRRRRGRGGRGERGGDRVDDRFGDRPRERPPAPAAHAASAAAPSTLDALLDATTLLLAPRTRPAFMGTGAFGGPWSTQRD
jgi:poly(A) polymerase